MAFIDCEGFGNKSSDKTRDAQLVTLCALLSSVFMLNSKGALNETMFNSLALACRFADHIEERGNEANRPLLLWVLRDFMLELRDAGGRPITPDDYLEQALHAAPAAGNNHHCSQAAHEVRQSFLRFFSHRGCMTLVRPANEETQLQHLENVPYAQLRKEFRAGVEALCTQLIATCHANPKTIGGQPLGCFGFVALLRQLVGMLNDGKVINLKGAWETVQHHACGALLNELQGEGKNTLRLLSTGQKLPGGAQLPLSDETLQTVLRDRRHHSKATWDERAVGDEKVRKEYWQELKESLAREETVVRQQNARLADTKLAEVLKTWQAWLDDDNGTLAAGEEIIAQLAQLMDRMPAAPVSRTTRAAIEAAGRRVASARSAVAEHVQESKESQRQALTWGQRAAHQEGEARSALEQTQAKLQKEVQAHGCAQTELQARNAELEEAKKQLQSLIEDLDAARIREHDLKIQQRLQADKEATLLAELEQVRASFAKSEAERLANERCAKVASESSAAQHERIMKELDQARAEAQSYRSRLGNERDSLQKEHERTRAESLQKIEETRSKLEAEQKKHNELLLSEKQKLLEKERHAGVLEGQTNTLAYEAGTLRNRVEDLQRQIIEAENQNGRHVQDTEKLKQELAQALQRQQEQACEYQRMLAAAQQKKCCVVM